jgi:hypothetical protein
MFIYVFVFFSSWTLPISWMDLVYSQQFRESEIFEWKRIFKKVKRRRRRTFLGGSHDPRLGVTIGWGYVVHRAQLHTQTAPCLQAKSSQWCGRCQSQSYKATRKYLAGSAKKHALYTQATWGKGTWHTASNNKVMGEWERFYTINIIGTVKDKITVIFQNQLGTTIIQIPKQRNFKNQFDE